MFDSYSNSMAPHITVLPNRSRFEAAASRTLDRHAREGQDYALIHVALQSSNGTGSVSLRMLNLVGNALRAGMQSGEVAYLGDAEFAVLLHDTDDRAAAIYARTMATIISSFRVLWDDEMLSVNACIGGVMTEHCHDGRALLRLARTASATASCKHGCKLHMMHGDDLMVHPHSAAAMGMVDRMAFA